MTILVVDDEAWNVTVLEKHLVPQGYKVLTARDGPEALEIMRKNKVDLVLLDVMMPGMDGFEVSREIRREKDLRSIPVIMVTALRDTIDKVNGLEAGADDFLSKPIERAELSARVRAHLRIKSLMDEIEAWNRTLEDRVRDRTREVEKKNIELAESYHLMLEALISALDAREHETSKHSLRVAFYTVELAKACGVFGRELEEIAMGALLHDIGKIGVPDSILLKKGPLTVEEWAVMRLHPEMGWRMIKDIEFIGMGRELVLSHQEHFDGRGYPRGLKGGAIYHGARFFALVDALDAILSRRSYKEALPFGKVEQEIKQAAGTQFDPTAAAAFLQIPEPRWREIEHEVESSNFRTLVRQINRAGEGRP